jgi:hypothetical protein
MNGVTKNPSIQPKLLLLLAVLKMVITGLTLINIH